MSRSTQYFVPEGKRVKKSGPPTRRSKAITAASLGDRDRCQQQNGSQIEALGQEAGQGWAGEGHEKERSFRIADEANTLKESLNTRVGYKLEGKAQDERERERESNDNDK